MISDLILHAHKRARAHIHTPIIRALLPRSRLKWLRREPIYYYYKLYIHRTFLPKSSYEDRWNIGRRRNDIFILPPIFPFLSLPSLPFHCIPLKSFARVSITVPMHYINDKTKARIVNPSSIYDKKTVIPTNLISLVLLSPAVRRCKYLDFKGHIRSACSVLVYEYR